MIHFWSTRALLWILNGTLMLLVDPIPRSGDGRAGRGGRALGARACQQSEVTVGPLEGRISMNEISF